MKQAQRIACLATYGLAYHGLFMPSSPVIDAIAAYSGATLEEVVELADDALAQGDVPASLSRYPFVILVVAKGTPDAVIEDCRNYVQRTAGKVLQGVVWIEGRGEEQRISVMEGPLSKEERWELAGGPVLESDGRHFTVELKREGRWELMEHSWESPDLFDDEGEAVAVARHLAIRSNGERETRVVSPRGVVLATYRVRTSLTTSWRGIEEEREQLFPRATLPMLRDVREDYLRSKTGMPLR